MIFFYAAAIIAVPIAFAIPVVISEVIGGWTKLYTSPIRFRTSNISDLTGQVAIVTGANTGLGYETALELARAGSSVIVACRSEANGLNAVQKIREEIDAEDSDKIKFIPLDLSSFDSINKFAKSFQALDMDLHVLVNNAGIMKSPGAVFAQQTMSYGFDTTQDGFESHIGVNHIGPAYLTQLLLNNLKNTAAKYEGGTRIVTLSSIAEVAAPDSGMEFDQWVPENGIKPELYEDGKGYGQSKLANAMYTQELAKRLEGTGVTAYSCHPGVINTGIIRHLTVELEEQRAQMGFVTKSLDYVKHMVFDYAMLDVKGGALTQLHLSTAPKDSLVNGAYYHPIGRVVELKHSQARNETLVQLLWDETQKAIEKGSKYSFTN